MQLYNVRQPWNNGDNLIFTTKNRLSHSKLIENKTVALGSSSLSLLENIQELNAHKARGHSGDVNTDEWTLEIMESNAFSL